MNRRHRELTENQVAWQLLTYLVQLEGHWVTKDALYRFPIFENVRCTRLFNAIEELKKLDCVEFSKRGKYECCRFKAEDSTITMATSARDGLRIHCSPALRASITLPVEQGSRVLLASQCTRTSEGRK